MATFAELFCERYQVAPDKYVETMFWRCLHRRTWIFVPVLRWLSPNYFAADYELIQSVGELQATSNVSDCFADFDFHPRNQTFVRRRIKFRVSARRTARLIYSILPRRSRKHPKDARLHALTPADHYEHPLNEPASAPHVV